MSARWCNGLMATATTTRTSAIRDDEMPDPDNLHIDTSNWTGSIRIQSR